VKILKEFEDPSFFSKRYNMVYTPGYDYWKWGLGEDGNIYCQCSDFIHPNQWYRLAEVGAALDLSISDMKRLVKEFGHLLVFL